ncbi:IS110 family transposase [Micromonospora sp. NBC_01638]|uniref:IS110 family transposase n=1 Tax=Micromonospora sp. NBC_01638 TaxID=2975982 RepID=UPI00386B3EAA|nr:IS110 family transposase [Micromonospora sp. NBC_01638]WTD61926.1 IS110 family transposase [Micromonospora sp. NBC_01638]WTD64879.1 IS110 family transposase [Micromonospora sp. NBC_01638]
MEVVHSRCAGMDISKKDAKVCVRIAGAGRRKTTETVTTWGSMTSQILALRDHLVDQQVTCVVMEATSDYWKPFYYLLEDAGFEVMLVNARHVKTLPGRKTDVADATWLAQLGAHGLVRGSFVPPEPIRQLRDLTRARTAITRERGREVQRLEKLLEDAGIKLSAVASDILGVSGRAMLEALIAGDRDPAALADLAKRRLRSKIPQLTEALNGRFTEHHAFLARVHLDLIDWHTAAINRLTERIEVMMEPFQGFRDLICSIPGIGILTADVIIAETGADMTRFPTAKHLASWAGTTPGNNESAGKVKSSRTRPGNPYLQGALGAAAMACSQNPRSYLGARYRRIASRRGPQKANMAIQHSMLIAIWHMGTTGTFYDDPGADYFTRLHPDRSKKRAIHQLEAMGYSVTLEKAS